MQDPLQTSTALVLRSSSAVTLTTGVASAILTRMSADTLATVQGTSSRPFRIIICGVLTGVEKAISAHFENAINSFRSGSVLVEVNSTPRPHDLFSVLESISFDLLIVLNVMTFGGGKERILKPAELLSQLYERTNKPIIVIGAWWDDKQELMDSGAFACLDMPFTQQQVRDICRGLLSENGYILK